MSRKSIVITVIAVAIVAALGWRFLRHRPANQGTQQASVQQQVTAQVRTQLLKQASLPTELNAYGDVTTGKVEAVSFPRAGQVARLLVLVGQRVKRGVPLVTLASDPNAQAAYTQSANAVHFAQGELKRTEDLFALQLATQSQVDGARRALRDAQANLAAQRQLGGNLDAATVTAPFDGVVTAISVAQGDRLQPGATLLQLGHIDTLRVQLGIEPGDGDLVKPGMPVTLAPVQDERQTLQSRITLVGDLIDPKTQLLSALVELPAPSARGLAPGMRVRATIHVGQHEGWTLPRQAVLTDDQGSYVFQIDQGKAHRVAVRMEGEHDGDIAVSGKLNAALPVVVLGNYELQDGMAVRGEAQ
jgi:RND family efflux transporter MFP subunit